MTMQRDPERTNEPRGVDRSEGMGAIIAVVAVAAVIVMGLIYLMQSPVEPTRSVTSQAPTTTAPSQAPPATPPAATKTEPGKN